jgi:hypothetical protein
LRTIEHSNVDSTETLVGEQYSCPSSPKLGSKLSDVFRANTLPNSKKCDKLRRSWSDSENSVFHVSTDVLNKVPTNVRLIDDEPAEL